MDTVFVVGNGFDIDLGLKSKYSDFAASNKWPFSSVYGVYSSPLAKYLDYHKEVDKWLELEDLLGKYAYSAYAKGGSSLKKDKADFNRLKLSLSKYLNDISQEPTIDYNSAAAKLITRISKKGPFESSFYSFNYTEPRSYVANCKRSVSHVHGALSKDNIILGFGDNVEDVGDYNCMRKSFSSKYKPPRIIDELMNCRKAVFFGLSMGEVDYAYFDHFFEAISNPENLKRDLLGKEVYFFTYDEHSRDEILRNLFIKTKHRLSNLRTLNTIKVITTSDTDPSEISNIINSI